MRLGWLVTLQCVFMKQVMFFLIYHVITCAWCSFKYSVVNPRIAYTKCRYEVLQQLQHSSVTRGVISQCLELGIDWPLNWIQPVCTILKIFKLSFIIEYVLQTHPAVLSERQRIWRALSVNSEIVRTVEK